MSRPFQLPGRAGGGGGGVSLQASPRKFVEKVGTESKKKRNDGGGEGEGEGGGVYSTNTFGIGEPLRA